MKKIQTFRRAFIHLAIWAGLLSIPFLLRPDLPARPMPPGLHMTEPAPYSRELLFLVQNVLLIGFFYLNYAVLIPRVLTVQRRRWVYFTSILLCFLVFLVLVGIFQYYFLPHKEFFEGERFYQKISFMGSFFLFGLAWAASSGIRLNAEWKKAEERRRESENARLNAELNQLKSQLNPHFLFNTLNGIYTLTLTKNDAAPEAVLKLSHLLRYVTAETSQDFVPLERDLEHLQHFIALHEMRLTAKTPVTCIVEGHPAGQQIAPLLLLPFVENAFKFGSSARELSPINISLKIKEHSLEFTCQNQVRNPDSDSTGIGITNTRRRLDLLYPGRYELDIAEREGRFIVVLKITL